MREMKYQTRNGIITKSPVPHLLSFVPAIKRERRRIVFGKREKEIPFLISSPAASGSSFEHPPHPAGNVSVS
jgi:hypothetical protein